MARGLEDTSRVAVLKSPNILWADAELEGVHVNYSDVLLRIRESTKRKVDLRCLGHIGLSIEGFWDEVIIESGELIAAHPYMDRCLESVRERLGPNLPNTGSPSRNKKDFSTLVIRFIDGAQLLCVAASFQTVRRDE